MSGVLSCADDAMPATAADSSGEKDDVARVAMEQLLAGVLALVVLSARIIFCRGNKNMIRAMMADKQYPLICQRRLYTSSVERKGTLQRNTFGVGTWSQAWIRALQFRTFSRLFASRAEFNQEHAD